MTMSTRLAVMDAGRIVQVGTPGGIYEYPATRFVAEFIGAVNVFEGRVVESLEGQVRVRSDDACCDLLVDHTQPLTVGTPVAVAIRPEKMVASGEPAGECVNAVRGVVAEIGYLGDVSIYHVRIPSGRLVQVQLTNLARLTEPALRWDDPVSLSWQPSSGVVLPT